MLLFHSAAMQHTGAQSSSRGLAMATVFAMAGIALLAVILIDGQGQFDSSGEPVVLLKKAVTQKLHEKGLKCDMACRNKRAAVAAKMKALREEITNDYKSMVNFGNEAGYVPPAKSIKSQVMDGTLLGGGSHSDPTAPPPFNPNMKVGSSSSGSDAISGSSILPKVQSVSQMAKSFMSSTPAKSSSSSSSSHGAGGLDFLNKYRHGAVHFHSSHGGDSSGKAKWEKEFSFVHDHQDAASPVELHSASHKSAEPAVVRRAMQRALSFSLHRSNTEKAGEKLLGLHEHHSVHARKSHDPLEGSKFLRSYFGEK